MRRRPVRRIPVRVRQYWKLLAVCAAFLAVLTLVFGTTGSGRSSSARGPRAATTCR